jgi:DNA-binding Lrp family transcriptional regulator
LNPAKINKSLTFFARIRLDKQDEETLQKFADEILKLPQVLECYFMLGDYDAMIRVVAESIEDYRRFQSEYLSRIKGVQNLKTDVPSQTVKLTSVMPL